MMQNSLSRSGDGVAFDESQMQLEGAKAQARGEERGELFEYAIDGGTSLNRGEAAMVPIVSTDIGGEPLTIVDSGLQKGNIIATSGFYLRNTSGLHLQGGPITVFSDGIYGGDALVSNLSPNDSRLISYAVDLELVAMQEEPELLSRIVNIKLSDGILSIKRDSERTRSWTFKNKGKTPKSVLLQVPGEDSWKLADPKQLEGKAAGVQRFRFTAKPGDNSFSVKWLQSTQSDITVADKAIDDIVFYTNEKAISPALKARLNDFVATKRKLAELERQRSVQEVALKEIGEDQERIRSNMQALDRTSKLFKTYETKMGEQETRIEKVRAEIERLREAEATTRNSLRQLLAGLDIE
ncbi:hypothetical protein EON80_19075 [bacterium]|nr:MAG: hypothetical protein EON80_19075 [bacterium]